MKELKPFEAYVFGRKAALGLSMVELGKAVGLHEITLREKIKYPQRLRIREFLLLAHALQETETGIEQMFREAIK